MKKKSLLALLTVFGIAIVPLTGFAAFKVGSSAKVGTSGFSAATDAANQSYYLGIDFSKDQYSVNEVSVLDTKAPDHKVQPQDGFRCDVVSANDEVLYSFRFAVPNVVCTDTFGKGDGTNGCQTKESGGFSLLMPYFATAKLISLYDPSDKMVANADVSRFAKICGDNICQENENALTCPQDCKSGTKDGICDRQIDGVCDPDCAKGADPDCAATANYYYYVAAIAVLILLAGLAGYLIWRKNNKNGERAEGDDEEQN